MRHIPEETVSGNFSLHSEAISAKVEPVDSENETTTISFANEAIENIAIPEAIGASLSSIRFDPFDRDILVVNTVYKDPIFRKYYLYILKDTQWKPVVDGFILHVDNVPEEGVPIQPHPSRSDKMVRSYSVFDMDPESETKYQWILHEEETEILNR